MTHSTLLTTRRVAESEIEFVGGSLFWGQAPLRVLLHLGVQWSTVAPAMFCSSGKPFSETWDALETLEFDTP
jgi:hypothetical protein